MIPIRPQLYYPVRELADRAVRLVGGRHNRLGRATNVRPIFVVGSGRSGTTLLRRILCQHSCVYIAPETSTLGSAIISYRRNASARWPSVVRATIAELVWHRDSDLFDCDHVALVQELLALPARDRTLATIIERFYRSLAGAKNSPELVWGDNTPVYLQWSHHLLELFPYARFVHCLRDGVDVVESLVRTGLRSSYSGAATQWTRAVEDAQQLSAGHPGQVRTVRYEQLVTQPRDEVRSLCDWLNLGYEASMLDAADPAVKAELSRRPHLQDASLAVTATNAGKGRTRLVRSHFGEGVEQMDAWLERLGYRRIPSGRFVPRATGT